VLDDGYAGAWELLYDYSSKVDQLHVCHRPLCVLVPRVTYNVCWLHTMPVLHATCCASVLQLPYPAQLQLAHQRVASATALCSSESRHNFSHLSCMVEYAGHTLEVIVDTNDRVL
jgi:hypothetical protein